MSSEAWQRMIEKAAWLISEGRIVKISNLLYYVIGRHSRHLVRVVDDSKLVCSCAGYKNRGVCSHVIAVSTLRKIKNGAEIINEIMQERIRRELRQLYRGEISR
ncbi:MAG: hypothetical protein B6U95_06795 [Thermofilum sp. ex4484_82]|nr:hypothetical protein [Thermoproteales archaeon]OYT27010.1 MAG: hypothetical protein B6U95_06795 [Thermofilum sp. ex4484_82]OYT37392.1 MAG: hypothetical protein B6U96_06790 [Archaeoglobales archaeon ex4484_92]RLE77765.1 MAG: hypothetical protein DRJ44_01245 [Thermoprotei archaeon]RLE85619.1 MAG: hypothetical protein DRJ39_01315 [Thermoprotei archaeon]